MVNNEKRITEKNGQVKVLQIFLLKTSKCCLGFSFM